MARHPGIIIVLAGLLLLLGGCALPWEGLLPTAPAPTAPPAPDSPMQDARSLIGGVCFNYWVEQVNRLFVIQSAGEHIAFYNEVDESGLCRFPVIREPFEFGATGRILVGAVNVGTGCHAVTDPLALVVDDEARTVTLRVRWQVTGACDYRLARPFWVSIPRPPEGYAVQLEAIPE